MKKVKMSLSIIILLVTLAIGCAFCFVSLQNAKKEFAEEEKKLPESAITLYLEKIQNKDFDGLYEDSLAVSKHLNSKESYIAEMERIYGDVKVSDIEFASINTNEYQLASKGKYLATVQLQQASDGSYLASTLFSGDNNYVLEGVTLNKEAIIKNNVYWSGIHY